MLENTQAEPTSAITGAVLVGYNQRNVEDCKLVLPFIQRQYGYNAPVVLINTDIAQVEGFYLSEDLYNPTNLPEVEEVLWVLEDVLGNTPLEEFCTQSTPIDIQGLYEATLHEAYYSHNNVTLRIFIIQ